MTPFCLSCQGQQFSFFLFFNWFCFLHMCPPCMETLLHYRHWVFAYYPYLMSSAALMPEEWAVCMSYLISVRRGLRFLLFCSFVVLCECVVCSGSPDFPNMQPWNWKEQFDFLEPVLALHPLAWLCMLTEILTNLIPTWHGTQRLVSFTSCGIQFVLCLGEKRNKKTPILIKCSAT